MKKAIFTLTLTLGLGAALLTSCGSDDGGVTPKSTTTERTVDKSKLLDKDWYSVGEESPRHRFNADGTYKSFGGSWEWLNGGDSMNIIRSTSQPTPVKVFFKYIEDEEMAFSTGDIEEPQVIFKTSEW